ncbi:hypothetical protein KHQ81_06110 [Mycoplasmatota bacterium]|nr:hypothetical protein KHQ81_06110 [Mycoplasmatota bacterium]
MKLNGYIKFILIFTILLSIVAGCSKYKYIPGKDTLEIFGDGTLQILRSYFPNGEMTYGLMNIEKQSTIEINIYEYKYVDDRIYIIGEHGYTVVNSKTCQFQQCEDYSCFSKNGKKVFEEHSDFTVLK